MSTKTKLERLAEHYDHADTGRELEAATEAAKPDGSEGPERMTTFAVRLPTVVLDHLREVAERRQVTTSALIRSWIEVGLAEDGGDAEGRVVSAQALLELIGRAPRGTHDH